MNVRRIMDSLSRRRTNVSVRTTVTATLPSKRVLEDRGPSEVLSGSVLVKTGAAILKLVAAARLIEIEVEFVFVAFGESSCVGA